MEVWGRGLAAAVEQRYGAVAGATAGVQEAVMHDLRHEIGARFVEVVGFDKVNREQSNLAGLRRVCVEGLGVRGRWGREEEQHLRLTGAHPRHLAKLLPCLRDLNLSSSLVSSWEEAGQLARELQLEVRPHFFSFLVGRRGIL